MLTFLCIVYDAFCPTMAGLSSCQQDVWPNGLKYFLSGPLWKKLANSWNIIKAACIVTSTY